MIRLSAYSGCDHGRRDAEAGRSGGDSREHSAGAEKPAAGVLLAAAIAIAGEVKQRAEEFMQNYSVDGAGIAAVVKITGIAYTAQFSADICRDAGESAVASRIELAGRLMMLLAALPMVFSAVEAICGLVSW